VIILDNLELGDPSRSGVATQKLFFASLDSKGINLEKREQEVLKRHYPSIDEKTKEELFNYLAFEKDLMLISPKYADLVGYKDPTEATVEDMLAELVEAVLKKYMHIEEYARAIDRGVKGYLNKGDFEFGLENLAKPKFTAEQIDMLWKTINPNRNPKIYYTKLAERLSSVTLPMVKAVNAP
jgi:hypothetical protein